MKKVIVVALYLAVYSCAETPIIFDEASKTENTISVSGESKSLGKVLETFKGKTLLIDIWASWCSDCIKGLPDVRQLQKDFPEIEFVFLSVDRNESRWKRSISKYNIEGHHYFLPNGQNGAFWDFLNSNWTPRYMVIDTEGNIKLFKAKKATDSKIREALN